MPHYLLQVSYTPEAWAAMAKNPQDRVEKVRPAIEGMGGKIVSAYFAFGDDDLIVIVEMPDNVSAAAFAMSANAGGAVSSLTTTPLLTTAEAVEAMKKAGGTGYKPPS